MNERVAIVIIGRNEGERLRACLESMRGEHVVYVDSGSSDGSVELAASLGVQAISLEPPYSAARGRNAGLALLGAYVPAYVQFVDGDCTLGSAWLAKAVAFMEANPATAAVAGVLRERHPEASIYNRLCNLEWQASAGRTLSVGGIALYRSAALAQSGPFDPDIAAGEEPELCLRLRNAGWTIRRIDVPMATHDAGLLRFAQWWRRTVRGGRGAMDVYSRTKRTLFRPLVRRAIVWGFVIPFEILTTTTDFAMGGHSSLAAAAMLAGMLIYMLQLVRMSVQGVKRGLAFGDALLFGVLSLFGKFAEVLGIFQRGLAGAGGSRSDSKPDATASIPSVDTAKTVRPTTE